MTTRSRSRQSRSRRRADAAQPGTTVMIRRSASSTTPDASCATTSTAPSTRTCGGAISPPTALYYNIADFSLWDYVGGTDDIAARTLKLIGDPETRYREDPVRMLRAARFEAKLGFQIDAGHRGPDSSRCADCWPACRRRGCSTRR